MSTVGKHIVILTPGFARDEKDTTCIPVLQQYLRTYKAVYQEDTYSVISFQYPQKKQYNWHGLNIWAIGGGNSRFPFRLLTWLRVISAFKKIHNAKKVDIIHSFWLTECS